LKIRHRSRKINIENEPVVLMQNIRPSIAEQDIACAETAAPPSAMIVFGASGDLAKRKLFVSLFQLYNRGLLSDYFYLLGAGRKELSDENFRRSAQQAIQKASGSLPLKKIETFVNKFYYVSGDYGDTSFYENIKARLIELDKKYKIDDRDIVSMQASHIFYLAVPPFLYPTIGEQLGSS